MKQGQRADVLSVFMTFVQTAQSILKQSDSRLRHVANLSVAQFVVLMGLSIKGTMTGTELADLTDTRPNNITLIIDRLKRNGLVTAKRISADKRVLTVRLTDKGKSALDLAMPSAQTVVRQIMASLTEADVASLDRLLTVIRGNADQLPKTSRRRTHNKRTATGQRSSELPPSG